MARFFLLFSVALAFSGANGLFIKVNPDMALFNDSTTNGSIPDSANIVTGNATADLTSLEAANNTKVGNTSMTDSQVNVAIPSVNATDVSPSNLTDVTLTDMNDSAANNTTADIMTDSSANDTTADIMTDSSANDTTADIMTGSSANDTTADMTGSSANDTTADIMTDSSANDTTATVADLASDTNSTTGNFSASAESIDMEKDFNETKFLEEKETKVSIPDAAMNQDDDNNNDQVCERGFRPVLGLCVLSKFTRDLIGSIVSPPCDEDEHCPMNSVCDPSQLLCQCANGQPLDETHCEASDLGGRCDDFGSKPEEKINVVCKSPWTPCVEGVCSCHEGQYRKGSSCIPLLSLDNDCASGGIPCRGDEVACLDASGGECGQNATCACRCNTGFVKNADKKTCEKPSKPATDLSKEKRAKEKATTSTTTTTTPAPKPTKPNGASSFSVSHTFYAICGLAFTLLL